MKKVNVIYTPTGNLEEFRIAAKQAKELGATHVMAGQMPRSRWMWEEDLSNPYVNWSMGQAQIFKLKCPPQLEPYLPKAHIEECFRLFRARCEILKELGLKPALFSNEPFWLPERVYRDHPTWRGARCDHPRRSRCAYYSPCIENPEVLAMYRWAISEICRETGLDYINFKTNDCGGGLSFSSGTYSGPNGASRYRNCSMTDQVCGFLRAISEGAKDGGVSEPVIHFSSDLELKEPEYSVNAAIVGLQENQIINHRDRHGDKVMKVVGGTGLTETVIPGLPKNLSLVSAIDRLYHATEPVKILRLSRTDLNDAYLIFRSYLKLQPENYAQQCAVLLDAAKAAVGEEGAGLLLDIWKELEEAQEHIAHTGLDLIQYGCQHQRWINRPFVLFPDRLKEEEKSYYRRFQFQAQDEAHAEDLMDLQGIEGVRGFTAVFMLTEITRKAIASLQSTQSDLDRLIEVCEKQAPDASVVEKLSLLRRRVAVYECFVRNMENACRFQELVDRTDKEAVPVCSLRWPTRSDHRAEEFQEITRNEIDNAYALADLCEGHMEELFACAAPEQEDIFTFSTELPKQLRKKAEIMLDHMIDGGRVFETNNI